MQSPRLKVQSNNLRQLLDIQGSKAPGCAESTRKKVNKYKLNTMSNNAVLFDKDRDQPSLDQGLSNYQTTRLAVPTT